MQEPAASFCERRNVFLIRWICQKDRRDKEASRNTQDREESFPGLFAGQKGHRRKGQLHLCGYCLLSEFVI